MSYVIDLIVFALVILVAVSVGYAVGIENLLAPKAAA